MEQSNTHQLRKCVCSVRTVDGFHDTQQSTRIRENVPQPIHNNQPGSKKMCHTDTRQSTRIRENTQYLRSLWHQPPTLL